MPPLLCSAHRTSKRLGKVSGLSDDASGSFKQAVRRAGYGRSSGCVLDTDNQCIWKEEKFREKRIMTVDDSTSVRQMVGFTLKQAGYEVVEATDGKDALSKPEGSGIRMVLTDLNMPNLDGIGLIKGLRAHQSYRFIPIVMLTTESQEGEKLEGKQAGAYGVDREALQAGAARGSSKEGAGMNENHKEVFKEEAYELSGSSRPHFSNSKRRRTTRT